jgi:hypothetical protein
VLPLGYAADGAAGTERTWLAAAAALAFELAGRLQAELEALDWITGEQKVTQARSRDLDVSWREFGRRSAELAARLR